MKFYYLLVSVLLWTSTANAQNPFILESNNARVFISDEGTFFNDFNANQIGYEIPIGSGRTPFHSLQFWFAGLDTNNQLHMMVGGEPNVGTDVFNGPISNPGTYSTPTYQAEWENSMFSICQETIDNFMLSWNCDNVPGTPGCENVIPLGINEGNQLNQWPGNGNTSMGQSNILAPYWDRDGNGNYNPSNGDTPIIKGCCATYLIQNDLAQPHTYTTSSAVGLEIHYMFYQFHTWDYLDDVTFVDVMAINKSGMNYPEFNHSVVVDADLGYGLDDFFGSDSLRNLMYFYNGDNLDETTANFQGYGANPPAVGIVSLGAPMSSCVPYSNANSSLASKWNQMKGLQENGAPFSNPNQQETGFVYSGNPNSTSEWSAISSGVVPDDVRAIGSSSLSNFNDGDTIIQTYAIVYARTGNHLQNVNRLKKIADELKAFFEMDSIPTCQNGILGTPELKPNTFEIYPNPSAGVAHITSDLETIEGIEVYNSAGRLIYTAQPKSYQTKVDLGNQTSGMYFLYLSNNQGTQVHKIILE